MSRGLVWLLAGSLVVALAVTLLWRGTQSSRQVVDELPDLSSHSSAPFGTRGLFLWLSALGYQPERLEYRPFRLDQGDRVLFLLNPSENLSDEQVIELSRWIEGGGTAVVVPDPYLQYGWLGQFGIQFLADALPAGPAAVTVPLSDPSLTSLPSAGAGWFRLDDPAWVSLAQTSSNRSVAATRALGSGRLYLIASPELLSNRGLHEPANAAFALHLLDGVPRGGTVLFDEYHHGLSEYSSLWHRLLREPWGWGILTAALLCFAYLLMAGRRFGPPIRVRPGPAKRGRAEFATNLAGLLAAGDQREWLRHHYVRQVRQSLGTHFRVRSDLPVAEFVAQLASQRPQAAGLAEPLATLEGPLPGKGTLLRAIRQVEELHARILGRTVPAIPERPAVARAPMADEERVLEDVTA